MLFAVMHFPDVEHRWAYSAIIDMLNDRDRPIPDDAAFICGFTGLTRKKWAVVRRYLLDHRNSAGEPDKLCMTAEGEISNPRFERERADRPAAHAKAVENGRIGGRKSAAKRAAAQSEMDLSGQSSGLKSADKQPDSPPDSRSMTDGLDADPPMENNEIGQAPPQATRAREESRDQSIESLPTTTPLPNSRDGEVWDAVRLSNELCRIGGIRNLEPGRIAGNVVVVREWLDAGADPPLIARIVQAKRDRASRGLYSLKYFDPAIRQAIAQRDHPNAPDASDPSDIRDPILRRYLESGGQMV